MLAHDGPDLPIVASRLIAGRRIAMVSEGKGGKQTSRLWTFEMRNDSIYSELRTGHGVESFIVSTHKGTLRCLVKTEKLQQARKSLP